MTSSHPQSARPDFPACRSCSFEAGNAWRAQARAPRRWLQGLALLAALALGGCAIPYRLDSQVNSFSALTGVPASGYRFERMPLQQADPNQARVEALAQAALARAGLRRDDAAPAYGVQAWAVVQQVANPWGAPAYAPYGPYGSWGAWGRPYGSWGHLGVAGGSRSRVGLGVSIGMPLGGPGPYDSRTWLRRDVGLVMRELATGQVVYQTQAVNDGPWLDPDRTLGTLFDAALQGFPQPPAGARRVDILMPR